MTTSASAVARAQFVFLFGLNGRIPELRESAYCQNIGVIALYLAAAFVVSAQVRKAYRAGGWPAVGRVLLLGTWADQGAAAGDQAGQAGAGGLGWQGGQRRAVDNRHRTTVDEVTTALQRLPMEEHASESELHAMPVHALKERLAARGVDCSHFVEKSELLEQLARLSDQGGSSSTSCSVCCEDYVTGDVVRVLPCGHRFHIECIDQWLLKATDFTRPPACPLCNAELIRR